MKGKELFKSAVTLLPRVVRDLCEKEGVALDDIAQTITLSDALGLNLMTAKNEAPLQTAFTISIEAAEGVTTGISAHDRPRTIRPCRVSAFRGHGLLAGAFG